MPVITTGTYVQALVNFRYSNGVTGLNRFHFVASGTGSAEYEDVIIEVSELLGQGYQQWLPVCANVVRFETVDFAVVAYSYVEQQWRVVSKIGMGVLGMQGGSTSEPLPSTVTASVTLTTGIARVRGRKSIPGLTDAIVDQDTLVDTAINRLALATVAWRTVLAVGTNLTLKWVLLHRVGGHTGITGVKINRIVGSQDTRDRRRHI